MDGMRDTLVYNPLHYRLYRTYLHSPYLTF